VSSDSLPLDPRALIEHREFVRMLAKSLLGDEHAAQDVAQDTLLTLITHPPRSFESVRGWLAQVTRNRARNATRESERRTLREAAVARPEAHESESSAQARLAVQHRVVEAVLALREPYQSVIVLAYYEGSSAADIARRRNIPAGTVRAQLSRALDLLRAKLDAETDGGRQAWSAVLAGLVTRSKPAAIGTSVSTSTKVLAACVLVAGGVAVPVVWWWSSKLSVSSNVDADLASMAATPPEHVAPPEPAEPELSTAPSSRAPVAVAQHAAGHAPAPSDLERHSLGELLHLAVQAQRLVREKLFAPDDTSSAPDELRTMPGVSLTRIHTNPSAELESLTGVREGGRHFSFATGSHDFDMEPDISFMADTVSVYGNATGFVLDLGVRSLTDVPPGGDAAAKYELMCTDAHTTDGSYDSSFVERARALNVEHTLRVEPGHAYAVRVLSSGEHDILAVFTVVGSHDEWVTIAWRKVQEWPIHGERRNRGTQDPFWMIGPAPDWMTKLAANQLLQLMRDLRRTARPKLFDVPRALKQQRPALAARSDAGFARILERGRFDALVDGRGGGAYYSFATQSNDYDGEPDLELQHGRFSSGFAGGDIGFLLDLGTTELDAVGTAVDSMPRALAEADRDAWRFLWTVEKKPRSPDRDDRWIDDADRNRARALGVAGGVPAVADHTYLLRSILFGLHDHLVAFRVVAADEHGQTIAWRVVRTWPEPRGSRSPKGAGQDGMSGMSGR
jgi:RNA polymerase sigma-70 factor (ECF subfamily)